MKRKRVAITPIDAKVETSVGREVYKGHLLVKWLRRIADTMFWNVEIYTMGIGIGTPLAFAQRPCGKATLDMVVRDAKLIVGQMFFFGADLPAVKVPDNYLAKEKHPFDVLNPISASGKPMLCPPHWQIVRDRARAGNVNAIVANMKFTAAFLKRVTSDGILSLGKSRDPYTMQLLLDSYSPLCCWLGDDTFYRVLRESDPVTIFAKIKE